MTRILSESPPPWEPQSSPSLDVDHNLKDMDLLLAVSLYSLNVETNGNKDLSTVLRAQKLPSVLQFRMAQICSFKQPPRVAPSMVQEVISNAIPLKCREMLARPVDRMQGMPTLQCLLPAQVQLMAVRPIQLIWNVVALLSLTTQLVM